MSINISTIKKEIETYLKHNKIKEYEMIPFKNIFNNKYDDSELMEVIQENISYVDIDGNRYYIGIWNCCAGIFFLVSITNVENNVNQTI